MIRNLVVSQDIAALCYDGMATCNAAMNALHMYFRDHVYTRSKENFIHPKLIDEHVINIMTTAFHKEEPHLKSMFKVILQRDEPTDYVMDVIITVDDMHLHLVDITEGSYLCH